MELYEVVVRNELTGEVQTLAVRSQCARDAQVEALSRQFRLHGWRKALAFPADANPSGASLAS